ncbi:transcriptional regulator [uncultured Sphingomonas sp.]|uniref:transcriptional regulator n=1 Tax=uncultured Sphingomonas sp. TaxID=158754 RepID=UPI0025F32344|nr:transcriptional regulator [uncultured Sphingomonas sp.]
MSGAAPYAYAGLDRVFHERARLGIVTSLAGHAEGLGFSELKALCGLTDGNLARHLQVLEGAGFLIQSKDQDGRRAITRCRLTSVGRTRFADYLAALEAVLHQARARETTADSGATKTRPA